jgi:hypothetical protein
MKKSSGESKGKVRRDSPRWTLEQDRRSVKEGRVLHKVLLRDLGCIHHLPVLQFDVILPREHLQPVEDYHSSRHYPLYVDIAIGGMRGDVGCRPEDALNAGIRLTASVIARYYKDPLYRRGLFSRVHPPQHEEVWAPVEARHSDQDARLEGLQRREPRDGSTRFEIESSLMRQKW